MKKNDRRPTLRQKRMIAEAKLNTHNWLVRSQGSGTIIIVHRDSGNIRQLSC